MTINERKKAFNNILLQTFKEQTYKDFNRKKIIENQLKGNKSN